MNEEDIDRMMTDLLRDGGPLRLTIKFHSGAERNPPLGVDVIALSQLLFAGAVSEFLFWHASALSSREPGPYDATVFDEFGDRWMRSGPSGKSALVELALIEPLLSRRIFSDLLAQRNSRWLGDETLRMELDRGWKENPSFREILLAGAIAVQVLTVSVFGGIGIHKEITRIECEERARNASDRTTDKLLQAGRFEGHFPKESFRVAQEAGTAAILSCNTEMKGHLSYTATGGLVFEINLHSPRNHG